MSRSDWRLSMCTGSNSSAAELVKREMFSKYYALCPFCSRSCIIRRGRLIEHKPKRVKIHINNSGPFSTDVHRLTVQLMNGHTIAKAKRIHLKGSWIIRQYNNPVPCGEYTVLYAADETSTYSIES